MNAPISNVGMLRVWSAPAYKNGMPHLGDIYLLCIKYTAYTFSLMCITFHQLNLAQVIVILSASLMTLLLIF